jgi:hypothetical protein
MTKKILPLIGMALLSGPLAAETLPPSGVAPPQVLPILEFVAAIETGGYASYNLPVVTNFAPLDFATYLFITQPLASVENSANEGLVGGLVIDLDAFNNYWILSGPSASLFTTSALGTGAAGMSDTPQITAHYITNAISNAESEQQFKAPEMNANGTAGALTLLAGAVLVLLGRRPARPLV